MVDLIKLKTANLTRWNAASVTPSLIPLIDGVSHHMVAAKPRYQAVEAKTGVPWAVVAVIHERESSQSWAASLAQGDPWNRVSVHVPRGRGPFASWEAAAEDALVVCPPHAANWHDWTIDGRCRCSSNTTGWATPRWASRRPISGPPPTNTATANTSPTAISIRTRSITRLAVPPCWAE
jgi:hypothetical protein